jgi:hypothetical protein
MLPSAFLLVFLVIAAVGDTNAQTQTFGTWKVSADKSAYAWAGTIDDSGHVFGQFCDFSDGSCRWVVGLGTACRQGERYPVLVNSNEGSEGMEVYCHGELAGTPGTYTYAFTDFDEVTSHMTKGGRIGIAIPLNGDQFRVVRFDLTGAPTAIASMRALAASKTRATRPGTREERL